MLTETCGIWLGTQVIAVTRSKGPVLDSCGKRIAFCLKASRHVDFERFTDYLSRLCEVLLWLCEEGRGISKSVLLHVHLPDSINKSYSTESFKLPEELKFCVTADTGCRFQVVGGSDVTLHTRNDHVSSRAE